MFEDGHAIDLSFPDAPYETYEHSKDLYGNGSIVIATKSLIVCTNFVPPSRERCNFWISRHCVFYNLQNCKVRGKNDPVSSHHTSPHSY